MEKGEVDNHPMHVSEFVSLQTCCLLAQLRTLTFFAVIACFSVRGGLKFTGRCCNES